MLLELERECLDVYRRKVDEAANSKARLHQSVAAKEAELATVVACLGDMSVNSPVNRISRGIEKLVLVYLVLIFS